MFAKPRSSRSSGGSSKSKSTSRPKTSNKNSSTDIKSSSITTKPSTSTKNVSNKNNINNSNQTINTIPKIYNDYSTNNNYYYKRNNNFGDFLSNYYLYRFLTPHNRIYVVDGSTYYAPAYTGVRSIFTAFGNGEYSKKLMAGCYALAFLKYVENVPEINRILKILCI